MPARIANFFLESAIFSDRTRILAKISAGYLVIAGLLALADIRLTHYVLEHNPDTYELNVMVDATGMPGLLKGATKSWSLFSLLFVTSLAMCLANDRYRRLLQISGRRDEMFIRIPGATSIWYAISLVGALINNTGLTLFEFSWLQAVFGLFGLYTNKELMAGFMLFSVVSFALLIAPSYFVFAAIANKANRQLQESAATR